LGQEYSQQCRWIYLQEIKTPGEVQNEGADHLAEEQSHQGANLHCRTSTSFRKRIRDPLQNLPKRLIERAIGVFTDTLTLKPPKSVQTEIHLEGVRKIILEEGPTRRIDLKFWPANNRNGFSNLVIEQE
jgi:hypothetical protein